MHMVQRHLGDAAVETTKDALDEILALLKEDNLNDAQRKQNIDVLLGTIDKLTDEEFNQMTVLAACLTDYDAAREEAMQSRADKQDAGY